MNTVQTRTSRNLTIHRVRRRPDGKVDITFSLGQAGVWQNARLGSKVWFPPYASGFLMTPALNDPQHARDPLMVPAPGATFQWIWDAPMDGYGAGTLSGLRFELAYVNVYCCEEIEPGGLVPGGSVPPGLRPPSEPIVPPPPPPPGVPAPTPSNPIGSIPNPGAGVPVPNAGNQEPVPAPVPASVPMPRPQPAYTIQPTPFRPEVSPQFPLFPIQNTSAAYQNRRGQLLQDAPAADPTFFSYTQILPTKPSVPGVKSTVPQEPFFGPQIFDGPLGGTQQTANSFGLGGILPAPPYPVTPMYAGLFGLPSSSLRVTAFMPVAALPSVQRSVLYFAIENPNGSPMQGIQSMVIALAGDGTIRLVRSAALLQAGTNTPGEIHPGMSIGESVCVNWDQMPVGPALLLVVLMSQTGVPFASARATGVAYPMGAVTPSLGQVSDLLGPGLKLITGFQAGMQPTYEGSVNGIGDEDTYVFVPTHDSVSIVVQATEDARASGFEPVLDVYDVDDMTTPVATAQTRFQIGGVDVEPEYHSIGWQGSLALGQHYALVMRNKSAHYSRRWQFRVFHREDVPATGGTLVVNGGVLDGQLSTAYGRQSVQLLNDRTGEAIFVRTNERGVTDDIQRDTKGGSPSRLLAVAVGDKIDVVRPGPGALYRRSKDLIGQGTVS